MKYEVAINEDHIDGFISDLLTETPFITVRIRKHLPHRTRVNFEVKQINTPKQQEQLAHFLVGMESKYDTLIQPWTETSAEMWALLNEEVLT